MRTLRLLPRGLLVYVCVDLQQSVFLHIQRIALEHEQPKGVRQIWKESHVTRIGNGLVAR